jgi:hypothetical protein
MTLLLQLLLALHIYGVSAPSTAGAITPARTQFTPRRHDIMQQSADKGSSLHGGGEKNTHIGSTGRHVLLPAEKIFPDDPNSPAPIQQNTQPAATDRRYENGQLFGVKASGMVTAVRFYAAAAEAGP